MLVEQLFVNIIISVGLVKYLGIYAILIAQFVSQTVMAILAVFMSNSAEKVDFGLKRMICFIVEAALLMGAGMLIDYGDEARISVVALLIKMLVLYGGFTLFIFPYAKDFSQLILGLRKKKTQEG